MFDSRIFYLQMADAHRHRPQDVRVDRARPPRTGTRRAVRFTAGR